MRVLHKTPVEREKRENTRRKHNEVEASQCIQNKK
jgi:hypothetical protein